MATASDGVKALRSSGSFSSRSPAMIESISMTVTGIGTSRNRHNCHALSRRSPAMSSLRRVIAIG